MSDLLTPAELEAADLLAEVAVKMGAIIGSDNAGDWGEVASHIHALQNMILSQAAARAYPDRFRLIGSLRADGGTADQAKRAERP